MFLDIILNITQMKRETTVHQPTIENIIESTNISTIVKTISQVRYIPVSTLFKVSLPYLP